MILKKKKKKKREREKRRGLNRKNVMKIITASTQGFGWPA